MTNTKRGVIFISCGQVTPEEKLLGQHVCDLVRRLTIHEPYFAQNQNSLDGFTRNILGALHEAVAIIAIMHPRGTVKGLEESVSTRGSVWVEQEIAVAAYITQMLGRSLRIASYVHADIKREGMRDQLQLNSTSFREDSDVLSIIAPGS
jgi:hypothetical protein